MALAASALIGLMLAPTPAAAQASREDRSDYRQDDQRRSTDRDSGQFDQQPYDRQTRQQDFSRQADQQQDFSRAQGRWFGAQFSLEDDQLVVTRVTPDSLADRAGLREGDVLSSIDGNRVASQRDVEQWLSRVQRGRELALAIRRDGRQRTLYAEVDQRLAAQAQQTYRDPDEEWRRRWGMRMGSDDAAIGVTLDQRYTNAAVVADVVQDSPAEQAGLRRGDQIVSINGRRVASPRDLVQIIASMEPGRTIDMDIARRRIDNLEVTLGTRRSALRPAYGQEQYRDGQYRQDQSRDDRLQQFRDDRSQQLRDDRLQQFRDERDSQDRRGTGRTSDQQQNRFQDDRP
jgi:serine protease Do